MTCGVENLTDVSSSDHNRYFPPLCVRTPLLNYKSQMFRIILKHTFHQRLFAIWRKLYILWTVQIQNRIGMKHVRQNNSTLGDICISTLFRLHFFATQTNQSKFALKIDMIGTLLLFLICNFLHPFKCIWLWLII